MNTLNFSDIKLLDGQFTKSDTWGELVFENDGSFSQDEQSMIFQCGDNEVIVNFNYFVDAHIDEDNGDYYTPPATEAQIDGVDVTIDNIYINEVETNVDSETFAFLVKQVKRELNY